MKLYFTCESCGTLKSFTMFISVKAITKLNRGHIDKSEFTFSRQHRTWSFHVLVLQRTAKKCTKNYNVRAQLLFCSLKLLFRDVAVAVVVFLRSLMEILRVRKFQRHNRPLSRNAETKDFARLTSHPVRG